ncbi:MAG TPA: glycosyltransferase family 2 protein [Candidatus Dormibacteraeota bacterium]|nr:glycosyltransferase family 2 protein [Candidatus Dormibacteraeota bacterium]
MTDARVTIAIPTHQRRESLAQVLRGLARQTCAPGFFSVVVVCDGCSDGTQAMLHERQSPFEMLVLELDPAVGPAAARNHAMAQIVTPIVLFLDDDVIPDERLVEVHVKHHDQDSEVVVIGPLVPPRRMQQPWIRWEADTLQKQYEDIEAGIWAPTPRQFYTGNASVRREHIVAVGGFDPGFKRGEDVDLAFRLQRRGLHFVFEPRAVGVHIASRSFRSWVAAAYEYGRVEYAMGPVLGERGLVDVKVIEFQRRNPAVRRTVLFGLRHPSIAPAMLAAGGWLARILASVRLWKLARGTYTAIFEIAYWRGVEQADGGSPTALRRISAGRQRLRVPSESLSANR